MKAYTDLNQSKKLVEIRPLEFRLKHNEQVERERKEWHKRNREKSNEYREAYEFIEAREKEMGDRYQRDTKWKRKAKAYARRFIYRLPNAEMVVTREQMGVLEATINGSSLQYNPNAVAHVSGKDIAKAMNRTK